MLEIYHFTDAILAESVSTLRDVGVIKGLEADDALSMLAHNVVDTDFD